MSGIAWLLILGAFAWAAQRYARWLLERRVLFSRDMLALAARVEGLPGPETDASRRLRACLLAFAEDPTALEPLADWVARRLSPVPMPQAVVEEATARVAELTAPGSDPGPREIYNQALDRVGRYLYDETATARPILAATVAWKLIRSGAARRMLAEDRIGRMLAGVS